MHHVGKLLIFIWIPLLFSIGVAEEDPKPSEPRDIVVESGNYDEIVDNLGYMLEGMRTVIWVLDQSPSMKDDIGEVQSRIKNWLEKLDAGTEVGIVAFSERPITLLAPTKDPKKIMAAFQTYTPKQAGKEYLYLAIAHALKLLPARKYGSAIIVATDEAGDDTKYLATAYRALKARGVTFFGLSPNATFGNRTWKWTAQKFDKRSTDHYHSENGPESFTNEVLFNFHFVQRSKWTRLIYKMDYRRWAMKSGWAPFGLQILADHTTGRIYELETDTAKMSSTFKNKTPYEPDFKLANLMKNIRNTPWRWAVHQSVEYWNKNFKDIDREYVGSGSKSVLLQGVGRQIPIVKKNEEVAVAVLKQLRTALLDKKGGVDSSDSWEDEGASHLRWRANIELAYASASVARYHCRQFLADCDRFKQKDFKAKMLYSPEMYPNGSAGYKIFCQSDNETLVETLSGVADANGMYEMLDSADHTEAVHLKEMRVQAEKALKVVATNHPDTPWQAMADNLKMALGTYVPKLIPAGQWGQGNQNN